MAQFDFDINSVEKRESNYELLPAGWYTAQVVESALNDLKSGNGRAIKLTFQVLSDQFRGRKVWMQLNVRHNNPQTETIAQQQLRELCEAIGLPRMTDTTQLHNRPMQIRVKVRKDDSGKYEDQNEVSGFKPVAAGSPTATMPMPQRTPPAFPAFQVGAPAAPAAEGAVPPWMKRAA